MGRVKPSRLLNGTRRQLTDRTSAPPPPVVTPSLWQSVRLRPGLVLDFSQLPNRSLALDGVVLGRHIDTGRFRFSFDHHENPRFGVLSACEQVCDAIEMGLDPGHFRRILVNDVDRDVAAAVWLLLHPDRAHFVRERVTGLGRADSHGPDGPGATPTPQLRSSFPVPGTTPMRRDLYRAVEAVGEWLEGRRDAPPGPAPSPDMGAFAILCTDGAIVPAPFGAGGLYAAGWNAFVLGRELGPGRWQFTYAKRSDFVPFDFWPLLERIAGRESGWGGASTVGGSPRQSGSKLTPTEVAEFVRSCSASSSPNRRVLAPRRPRRAPRSAT